MELKSKFEKSFWDEDMGLFVIALDGNKEPCLILCSSSGQCLISPEFTIFKEFNLKGMFTSQI